MPNRIPGSMLTRQTLSDLIDGRLDGPADRPEPVRLTTRLTVEEALEGEQHGANGKGCRNGSRTGRLKTAEGRIEYAAPQTKGLDRPWRSGIRERLKGRTEALDMLAHGLPVRDIEDTSRDESSQLLLSRTAASEVGERLWADCREFAVRDLSEYDIACMFVDGVAERIHQSRRREPGPRCFCT